MAKREIGVAYWAGDAPVQYGCYIASIARYDGQQSLDDLIGELPDHALAHDQPIAPHWVLRRNPQWWESAVCWRDDELAIVLSATPHRPFRIALPDGGIISNDHGDDKCFRYLRSAIDYADRLFPFDEPMPVLESHYAAFRLVANANDWKADIDAHLSSAHDLRAVIDAIGAYTGNAVTVLPEPGGYHLVADGARWTRSFEQPPDWLKRATHLHLVM